MPKLFSFFRIRSLEKNTKIVDYFAKYRLNMFVCFAKILLKTKYKIFGRKNAKDFRKKSGREINNCEIVKLLMLSSQSRIFHKVFVQLAVAARRATRHLISGGGLGGNIFCPPLNIFRGARKCVLYLNNKKL